jgi:carboxylesterase type B
MRLSNLLSVILAVLGASGFAVRSPFLSANNNTTTSQSCYSSGGNFSEPVVHTPIGTIRGTFNPATPCVHEFLGIPYAQPPIGDLRFAPPQKPVLPRDNNNNDNDNDDNDNIIYATQLGPSCMQFLQTVPKSVYTEDVNEFNLEGLNATSCYISEDCLTLSVYTPSNNKNKTENENENENEQGDRLLPVILFLHGGAFTSSQNHLD